MHEGPGRHDTPCPPALSHQVMLGRELLTLKPSIADGVKPCIACLPLSPACGLLLFSLGSYLVGDILVDTRACHCLAVNPTRLSARGTKIPLGRLQALGWHSRDLGSGLVDLYIWNTSKHVVCTRCTPLAPKPGTGASISPASLPDYPHTPPAYEHGQSMMPKSTSSTHPMARPNHPHAPPVYENGPGLVPKSTLEDGLP